MNIRSVFFAFTALVALVAPAAVRSQTMPPLNSTAPPAHFAVFPEFLAGSLLSKHYAMAACGGSNISPALRWTDAPSGTKSFIVAVTDSDSSDALHWLVTGIPPKTRSLPSGAGAKPKPSYGRYVKNSYGHARYDGPCPGTGSTHHYTITVYALDVAFLPIEKQPDLSIMTAGHILAEATTIFRYKR